MFTKNNCNKKIGCIISLRDEVRTQFISIMSTILNIHEDEKTEPFYQSLLDKGIDQQRAIELLAFITKYLF